MGERVCSEVLGASEEADKEHFGWELLGMLAL